jgi:type II secretory pathway component PulJ
MIKNNRGITLIELLVTISLSLTIMGLISGVLMQSFRSMEISDTHINFRQEANIIISMISGAHLSAGSDPYTITYQRSNSEDWVMTIGENSLSSQNYDIRLELKSSNGTSSFVIDTSSTTVNSQTLTINKKIPINVHKLTLINKKDRTNKFEISTIISRL